MCEDNLTEEEIQKIINEIKPDGLEVYYIYVDRNNKRINQIEKWNKLAQKNNLFTTIGSDFHVKDDIRPEIGLGNTEIKLNKDDIETIIGNIIK